jgi:hypothetical protein
MATSMWSLKTLPNAGWGVPSCGRLEVLAGVLRMDATSAAVVTRRVPRRWSRVATAA